MDSDFVATRQGRYEKSVVAQRHGNWEGVWVAGYMPSERVLLEMRRDTGEIRRWMPQSLLTKHRVSPGDTSSLDAVSTFSRYACAAVHSLYGQEGQVGVDLLVARTLPLDETEWKKVRAHLRKYYRRPGAESHKRTRDYGEVVCLMCAPDLPTYESFQERLARTATPGTYSCRRHLDTAQMLPILLGTYRLDRKDAISEVKWEDFLEPRRRVLSQSIELLGSRADGAHLVSQLLDETLFLPMEPRWHSRFYRLRTCMRTSTIASDKA
jgi:hypothetical protein